MHKGWKKNEYGRGKAANVRMENGGGKLTCYGGTAIRIGKAGK